ncbi:hypothetical protein EP331_01085 [bacterium]|nr:MAG: hypothetical protein EP331_01085 [bacterium]
MLKVSMKIALLLSVLIFLVLMGIGMMWQIALMRSVIAYLILMIVFYASVLLITITRGRRAVSTSSDEYREA